MSSLGPGWLDPNWLLVRFGQQMFLVSAGMVFVECGLLFPFLPGDSLLFSVGLFIRRADLGEAGLQLSLPLACVLLTLAAFAGNVVGYEIGRLMGPGLYRRDGRVIRREYLDRTRTFFERRGPLALVLGRFIPVVRTFVTVVAGVTGMRRIVFWSWSLVGACAWATGVTCLGYALGGIQALQGNIDLVLAGIIAVSLIPAVVEWARRRRVVEEGTRGARDDG